MKINKIYQENCFDRFKSLSDKSIDCIFTSPPYNRKRNDKYEFYDDTMEDYFSFLCKLTDECIRVTKRFSIINIQKNFYQKEDVFRYIGTYDKKIKEIFIWEKSNPMPASGFNITNAYEFFFYLSDSPPKSNSTYTKNVLTTSVNSSMTKSHKAVMHPDVSDWFIGKFCKPGELLYDPFMGTGTTAVSCLRYGVNYIGSELCEDYVKSAVERVREYSEPEQEPVRRSLQISSESQQLL